MSAVGMTAVRVGKLFPRRPWEGRILSLHEEAANLLHESGLLLSLVTRSGSMTDLSVELRLPGDGSLRSLLERGARAAGSANLLTLGDLAIDLSAAPLWSGALTARMLAGASHSGSSRFLPSRVRLLPGHGRTPSLAPLAGVATLLGQALAINAGEEGLAGLALRPEGTNRFALRCGELLAAVEAPATRRRRIPLASRPVALRGLSPLVGLGIGLTPSGDDFLAGALLGERIALLAGSGRPPLLIDREEIAGALAGTSAAGATLLRLALHDSFPAYLLDLAREVVAARGPAEVLAAVRRAATHGETSGSDACTGLWWYLRLLSRGAPGNAPAVSSS